MMQLNRTLTQTECPWLDAELPKGTEVFTYKGHTYGAISHTGHAVSPVEGGTPFFEVPKDALTW